MAKKLGKLFTLAVTAGTAAAAAYYYLQNKKAAVQEAPEEEDDFEKDPEDDFDDTDFTDDDFVDESEHPEEAKEEAKEDTPVFSSETKEDGHTYVTLDLKAAQDKAVQLRDTVFNKVGDTVSRIKNSSEYETVTGKINETVDKVRSNEDVQAVEEAAHTAAGAAKQAGSAAADLAKDAARYVADKVHTTVAEAAAEAKDCLLYTSKPHVRNRSGTVQPPLCFHPVSYTHLNLCSHMPGAEMIRTRKLSLRPARRISS